MSYFSSAVNVLITTSRTTTGAATFPSISLPSHLIDSRFSQGSFVKGPTTVCVESQELPHVLAVGRLRDAAELL